VPQFKNRTVLITGCSTGIGRCLALGLHERGYRVFASVRKSEDMASFQEAGLETLVLDLDSSESIKQAVAEVLERTQGRLYALINNGAYGLPGAVSDLSRDALRKQFETNLFGTHELTCLVLPAMRALNEGRIIQMSSILGFMCLPFRGAYQATKYALEGISDTLRLELRDTRIRVSLIEPGPIISRFRENAYAAFKANIDIDNSAYREQYAGMIQRLEGRAGRMPFTLPPEAVLKKTIHALEARNPKIRYRVTFPTSLFEFLRRLLPYSVLDRVLARTGDR
jgi:NAD(P)-dependent dehydrogenase (short-subunit alcohol dehydrogenase family)